MAGGEEVWEQIEGRGKRWKRGSGGGGAGGRVGFGGKKGDVCDCACMRVCDCVSVLKMREWGSS